MRLREFAPGPGRDDNDDVPDPIFVLANRWWNAAEKQPQIEHVLNSLGWSIHQVESEDDAVQLQHRDGTTYFISADDFDPDLFEISDELRHSYLNRAGKHVDRRLDRMARVRDRLNKGYEIYHADRPAGSNQIVDRFEADTPALARQYYERFIHDYESDVDFDLGLRRATGIVEDAGSYPKVLYHGSTQEIKGPLTPRQAHDIGGASGSNQNAIYATDDPNFAIAYSLAERGSDTGTFGWNKDPQLIFFGGKIRHGQNVYLHILPTRDEQGRPLFTKGAADAEWYSVPGVTEITPVKVEAKPVDQYLRLLRKPTPEEQKEFQANKAKAKQGVNEIARLPKSEVGDWGDKGTLADPTHPIKTKPLPGGSKFGYAVNKTDPETIEIMIFDGTTLAAEMDLFYTQDYMKTWRVDTVVVDPDYRGQGLGKALYGIALSILKLTVEAGESQTRHGQQMWLMLNSIPGVEVQGYNMERTNEYQPRPGDNVVDQNKNWTRYTFPVKPGSSSMRSGRRGTGIYTSQASMIARWTGR